MKCLILAAGKGSRLQHKKKIKPLIEVLGVPLIERVIRNAAECGADDFYVIVGKKADTVSSFLSHLSKRLGIKITTIFNEKWDIYDNAYSVLKAKDYINEPFLLLMCDHLVDQKIIKKVLNNHLDDNEILLGVDIRKDSNLIDLKDATKVKFENGLIKDIEKNLEDFNGFDTGVFYCSTNIFNAVEESLNKGKSRLTDAVKILSEKNLAKVVEIDNGFWIDIDTENDLEKAEICLLNMMNRKLNDGIISKKINRKFSTKISKYLAKYKITPNHISIISFLISCLAAYLFTFNSYAGLFFGGILAQIASIIDGCDGEIARLKYQSTKFGGWFDAVLDRYADAFLIWGLIWHELDKNIVFWGILALIGSFMVSYTADKYDSLMKAKIINSVGRIGRDLRVFIIFIGAILNQVFLTLAILAIIMNIEVIRRLWLCRKE